MATLLLPDGLRHLISDLLKMHCDTIKIMVLLLRKLRVRSRIERTTPTSSACFNSSTLPGRTPPFAPRSASPTSSFVMLAASLQAKHATQRISLDRVTAKRRVRMCSETAGPFERSPLHLASTKAGCSPLGAFRGSARPPPPPGSTLQHAMKARRRGVLLRKAGSVPPGAYPGARVPRKKAVLGYRAPGAR